MNTSDPPSPRVVMDFDHSPIPGLSSEISRSVVTILLSSPNAASNQALYQAWAVPLSPQSPFLQAAKVLGGISDFDLSSESLMKSECPKNTTASPPDTVDVVLRSSEDESKPFLSNSGADSRASDLFYASRDGGFPSNRCETSTKPWDAEKVSPSCSRGFRRMHVGGMLQKPRTPEVSESACCASEEASHSHHPVQHSCRNAIVGGGQLEALTIAALLSGRTALLGSPPGLRRSPADPFQLGICRE